jgi:hypothetical protein
MIIDRADRVAQPVPIFPEPNGWLSWRTDDCPHSSSNNIVLILLLSHGSMTEVLAIPLRLFELIEWITGCSPR